MATDCEAFDFIPEFLAFPENVPTTPQYRLLPPGYRLLIDECRHPGRSRHATQHIIYFIQSGPCDFLPAKRAVHERIPEYVNWGKVGAQRGRFQVLNKPTERDIEEEDTVLALVREMFSSV